MSDYKFRTAAYLRLSKGDGDVDGAAKNESNSISNQRMIINRFIRDNEDFELVDTYIDDGYTGTDFDRPDMQRLLDDIDAGLIDCVVVKDFSRFGRERVETGTLILKEFEQKGIRFISINDNYDSLTAGSSDKHLVVPIKAMTNDFYSMDMSNKIRASQKVKREKGDFMAPFATYGYAKDPDNVNHLIVDPEAANVVKEIFAKRISGMSANAIAEYLRSTGVMTPGSYKEKHIPGYRNTGAKPGTSNWSAAQVIRILRDRTYTGCVVQGKSYRVSYKVKRIINNPEEEWVIVPGMHDSIISDSDFAIVQSLLKRDTIKADGGNGGYLFSGLLFCGDCGRPMIRRKRVNKNSSHIEYLCKGYTNKEGCSSHKILEEDLVHAVKASVNTAVRRLCRYSDIAANLEGITVSREEAIVQNSELKRLKEELDRNEAYRRNIFADFEDGVISKSMFEQFRLQYDRMIDQINRAISERTQLIDDLYTKGFAADEFISRFKDDPRIDELDRVLLVSLIDRILIYDNGTIEIVYRYRDQINALNQIMSSDGKEEEANGKNQK